MFGIIWREYYKCGSQKKDMGGIAGGCDPEKDGRVTSPASHGAAIADPKNKRSPGVRLVNDRMNCTNTDKMDLETISITLEEAERTARDRTVWRTSVTRCAEGTGQTKILDLVNCSFCAKKSWLTAVHD